VHRRSADDKRRLLPILGNRNNRNTALQPDAMSQGTNDQEVVPVFSFKLPTEFVAAFKDRQVDWGYRDAGGNALGEITFIRSYSRLKEDGTKERWYEVCQRVVNGMFSIQKDHCIANRLPWDDEHALQSAMEAYERMFAFKWLPPGRGLWMMGSTYVMEKRNSAALQNCAFVSTADIDPNEPAEPFSFLMEASMLGVGVGFDTKGGYKGLVIHQPDTARARTYLIPDSREGWVESVTRLLNSYLKPSQPVWDFDYSDIRPAGVPIKGFGGTASGPEPLQRLHVALRSLFEGRPGDVLSTTDVVDIANLIGVCVVAGNVRRSAELAMGQPSDENFINLKNPEKFPVRNSYSSDAPGWGWMSNNSLEVKVGTDYSKFIPNVALNGEPGFLWMDVTRAYGRLADAPDNKDWRAAGYNPCAEQSLESYELCTLVEVFLNRHESMEDFLRTCKFAFMYGKTVTLVPTHWEKTNAIMQRNRRIGCSISGIAAFADNQGLPELRRWMDLGYGEIRRWDKVYSEWLCVRESIKTTTVKPSGSVSILSGSTPGVHWSPGGKHFLRTIRFAAHDPMVKQFVLAGYRVEDDVVSANTKVVYFPVATNNGRSEKDVSIFEKVNLAAVAQRHWSDNAVSVTVSFDANEEDRHVETVLHMYEGQLKTVSFLPMGNTVYPQQPYTQITSEEYDGYGGQLLPVDFDTVYQGAALEAAGEAYCTTDRCELPSLRTPGAAEFEDNDADAGRPTSGVPGSPLS
jgi:ribonucleoside-triphosphate reductase